MMNTLLPKLKVKKFRRRIKINGAVQGVGFRPFVYHLATELKLAGFVKNTTTGVLVEVEGKQTALEEFNRRLNQDKPPVAVIDQLATAPIPLKKEKGFHILESGTRGQRLTRVLPDLAVCERCLKDIFDSTNRRFRYPFTNCTHCGPRYSIIHRLPYDRINTTMVSFEMCARCAKEFNNPNNRRFHAQPNACPDCGPALELWDKNGKVLNSKEAALSQTSEVLKMGAIVAVKGIGGFHLMADATNDHTLARLRDRKHRPTKPFAVMFPSIEAARSTCRLSPKDEEQLKSPSSPIVLVPREDFSAFSDLVAPGNPDVGAMIPTTPLHALIMNDCNRPLVATSGNISEEPICIDEEEAVSRLKGVADFFLVHNRKIVRPLEDSVVKIVAGELLTIRSGRGTAPIVIQTRNRINGVFATGAHLKNTVAFGNGTSVTVSQHIGDLDHPRSIEVFREIQRDLMALYDKKPTRAAHDLHPDYLSTQKAHHISTDRSAVQHHHAHIAACLAEHRITEPVLGLAWDGTGYGSDGTLWGGEALIATEKEYDRFGTFLSFPLPGGESAIRDPRRSALGLIHKMNRNLPDQLTNSFTAGEIKILNRMLQSRVNSPLTSSVGRLFDAVAALINISQTSTFEGESAQKLEYAARGRKILGAYPFKIDVTAGLEVLDWRPMISEILNDFHHGVPVGNIAATFHETLAHIAGEFADRANREQVVLSGGCFQNAELLTRVVAQLRRKGFIPVWPHHIPPNDGGISLGQVIVASEQNVLCV